MLQHDLTLGPGGRDHPAERGSGLDTKSEIRHLALGHRLLKMLQHRTLAEIQLLQRDGIRCVNVQNAAAKIANLERGFQMGIEHRRNRLMDRVTGQHLSVTAPGHQLTNQRPDSTNTRFVVRSTGLAAGGSIWVVGSA